jgi:hypothetical protein
VVDIKCDKRIEDSDRLQVDDPIFGKTEQFNGGELVYPEIIHIFKLIQIHITENQTFYPLDSAFGVPEHRALQDKTSLEFNLLAWYVFPK